METQTQSRLPIGGINGSSSPLVEANASRRFANQVGKYARVLQGSSAGGEDKDVKIGGDLSLING